MHVSKLLSRRSAAERHLLWVVAISSAALLPLFSLLLPEWRLEVADQIAAVLPVMSRACVGALLLLALAAVAVHAVTEVGYQIHSQDDLRQW